MYAAAAFLAAVKIKPLVVKIICKYIFQSFQSGEKGRGFQVASINNLPPLGCPRTDLLQDDYNSCSSFPLSVFWCN